MAPKVEIGVTPLLGTGPACDGWCVGNKAKRVETSESRLATRLVSKLELAVLAMALLVVAACADAGAIPETTAPEGTGVDLSPSAVAATATEIPVAELPRPTESPSKVAAAPTQTSTPSPTGSDTESPTATDSPTQLDPSPSTAPVDTPVPTAAPQSPPVATSTPLPPTSTPKPAPAPTPIPTPPPFHYATLDEALAGSVELGCSGWNRAVIDGTAYYRACASADVFDPLVSAANPAGPDAQATSTPADSAQPASTPVTQTPVPTHEAPAYHYATVAEAEAGTLELGCSGYKGVSVDGTFYYRACGSDESFELLASGAGTTISGAPCKLESDATVRFSAALTDLTQIASIVPAGSPSGGVIKPHSYLHNKDVPGGYKNVRVPVYAVADSVLSSVAFYNTSLGTSEYLIFFDVTCEISFKFDHISEVAPKIAAVAPAIPSDTSQTTRTDAITFEAGELIGYANGAGGQGAWDFGAYDTTYTNQFANQERYVKGKMGQSLHTVCPYDYYTEPLKSQMYALLGTHDQRIVPGVECTTTQRDVPGAVAGAWFDTQVLEFSDAKVSIAMLPGDTVAITGIGGDLRINKGQPTWLDPEVLTATHCYAGDGRWFFIEIQGDGMQMAIADGSGDCPNSLPADATIYYR